MKKRASIHLPKGRHNVEKVSVLESFNATNTDPPIVTDANFIPLSILIKSLGCSGLFPTLSLTAIEKHLMTEADESEGDVSSAAIITCDYEGTIRVFLKKACIDKLLHEAGPDGSSSSFTSINKESLDKK